MTSELDVNTSINGQESHAGGLITAGKSDLRILGNFLPEQTRLSVHLIAFDSPQRASNDKHRRRVCRDPTRSFNVKPHMYPTIFVSGAPLMASENVKYRKWLVLF